MTLPVPEAPKGDTQVTSIDIHSAGGTRGRWENTISTSSKRAWHAQVASAGAKLPGRVAIGASVSPLSFLLGLVSLSPS